MNPLPVESMPDIDPGTLANNYMQVMMLQTALSRSESNLTTVPRLVLRIIEEHAWRDRLNRNGQRFTYSSENDFTKFITDSSPQGLGAALDEVRRYLGGSDNPIRLAFEELVRKGQGSTEGQVRNPYGRAGKEGKEINRYPVTVNQNPDPAPCVPTDPSLSLHNRDYSSEAQTGNSVSYALRRLGKDRPDLYERVKAGEIKPKTAMREAGFLPTEISIPVEPQGAARRILNRFQGDQLDELIRLLNAGRGEERDTLTGDEGNH